MELLAGIFLRADLGAPLVGVDVEATFEHAAKIAGAVETAAAGDDLQRVVGGGQQLRGALDAQIGQHEVGALTIDELELAPQVIRRNVHGIGERIEGGALVQMGEIPLDRTLHALDRHRFERQCRGEIAVAQKEQAQVQQGAVEQDQRSRRG